MKDWHNVQDLFHAAADLPPGQQRIFLDNSCAARPEIRREVESLLASDRKGDGPITAAVEGAAQALMGADPIIGSRVGHWRVVREIGRGGMGAVYLAVRDDDFRQQAALKLVKYGMDTAEVLERFRRERQILANLDHPFIAHLIDGGSAPDGRPFLVMEYVEGQRIDSWTRDRNLSLKDRCLLFLKVCEAVACAHRNLVVHGDLKPGNILITSEGIPKLLDFGIARLLAPGPDRAPPATVAESRAITPGYASPEQVLGRPVTTSSDVYSLGAVLNELLGAVRLRRKLPGDLDSIVLMAMRTSPERRYSSVERFAADLRGYLEGMPVVAHPGSLAYRGGKFVRRHTFGLALAVLAGGSLLAGTLVTMVEARRTEAARQVAETQRHAAILALESAKTERARAESEAKRAGQRLTEIVALANHSLFDIHSQIERLPGATEARREIVGTTLRYLEELSKDAAKDEPLRQALAAAYFKLGDVQGYPYGPSLGDRAGALTSYRAAVDLLSTLHQAHPDDPDILLPWVDLQRRIAVLLVASGKMDEAIPAIRRALPDAALLAKLHPQDPEAASREGTLLVAMAMALETRNSAEALQWSRRSVAAFETLGRRFPKNDAILEQLADAHSRLGIALNGTGNLRPAAIEFRQCAEVRERLAAAAPNDVVRRRDLMLAYGHIAAVLGSPLVPNLGDSEGALGYYRKAVSLAEQTTRADPRNLTARYDLAAVMLRLGVVDVPPSGLAAALDTLRGAEATLAALLRASPHDVRYLSQLAIVQEFIGNRLRGLGKLPEAINAYRQSLAGAESLLAANPADRSVQAQEVASSGGLALALAASGDRAGALDRARAEIARTETFRARSPDKRGGMLVLARAWLALANVYRFQADWTEVRAAAGRALQEISSIPGGLEDPYYSAPVAEARALIAGQ
jgi:tetratricopeptide (TPR) repeat protein/predicted Ser/Thr protein kinase